MTRTAAKAKANAIFCIALAVIMFALYGLVDMVMHSNVLECIFAYRAIPIDFILGVVTIILLLVSMDDFLNAVNDFVERAFR